jgi:hypothetical protein
MLAYSMLLGASACAKTELKANSPAEGDAFGWSVAVSSNTYAVGTPRTPQAVELARCTCTTSERTRRPGKRRWHFMGARPRLLAARLSQLT